MKMKNREKEYSRITTQFAAMKGELMKHNTETKMALRLKKTVTDNGMEIARLKEKLVTNSQQVNILTEAVDAKMAHCEKEVAEVREENQKFYQISCERHETYLNLNEDFAKHKLEVESRMEKYKSEINGKIVEHMQRIEQIKHYR